LITFFKRQFLLSRIFCCSGLFQVKRDASCLSFSLSEPEQVAVAVCSKVAITTEV